MLHQPRTDRRRPVVAMRVDAALPKRRTMAMDRLFLAILCALVDFWALYIAATAVYRGYHAWWLGTPYPPDVALVFCAAVAGTTALLIFERRGYEMPGLTGAGHARMRRRTWLGVMVAAIVIAFATKLGGDLSRAAACIIALIGLGVLSLTGRLFGAVARFAQASGYLARSRVMLVGEQGRMTGFADAFNADALGLEVVGHVDAALFDAGPACRASVLDFARRQAVEEVFVALPWTDDERIARILRGLAELPVAVHLCPDRIIGRLPEAKLRLLDGAAFLQLARPPLDSSEVAVKRCFDVAVAATVLVILAPLLLIIAVVVRLDSPGPALFRQRRHGFNRSSFVIYKFRTMTRMDDGPVIRQARRHDPRVTRIGRFLRRTSLDELPQLYNVLRGDMSLVGPRPHALAHDDYYDALIRSYARRHNVRPGITGWAQVNGCRGETDTIEKMRKRIDLDLFYADNWSFGFDLKILRMTFAQIWRHDAY
ncbi:hypothetical protein AL346_21065 (plasmid) [Chelatococcus sp. CO-6]|nr:hypothetical protein AL346_21065 [Chelatococcus sp. CO-6]